MNQFTASVNKFLTFNDYKHPHYLFLFLSSPYFKQKVKRGTVILILNFVILCHFFIKGLYFVGD